MTTDFELLDAWRAGERVAGEELFDRHFSTVCRFFRGKVEDVADDLVQRTFLACVEHRDQFAGKSSFRTYLLTVARHELIHHFRRNATMGRPDTTVSSVADLHPSPSRVAADREEDRLLLDAMRSIPVDGQIVLELHYWEEMSSFEIAEVLEIPAGTVRSRLRRARALLKDQLERRRKPGRHPASMDGIHALSGSLRNALEATPE